MTECKSMSPHVGRRGHSCPFCLSWWCLETRKQFYILVWKKKSWTRGVIVKEEGRRVTFEAGMCVCLGVVWCELWSWWEGDSVHPTYRIMSAMWGDQHCVCCLMLAISLHPYYTPGFTDQISTSLLHSWVYWPDLYILVTLLGFTVQISTSLLHYWVYCPNLYILLTLLGLLTRSLHPYYTPGFNVQISTSLLHSWVYQPDLYILVILLGLLSRPLLPCYTPVFTVQTSTSLLYSCVYCPDLYILVTLLGLLSRPLHPCYTPVLSLLPGSVSSDFPACTWCNQEAQREPWVD